MLGADTAAVLAGLLGLSAADIGALAERGIIAALAERGIIAALAEHGTIGDS